MRLFALVALLLTVPASASDLCAIKLVSTSYGQYGAITVAADGDGNIASLFDVSNKWGKARENLGLILPLDVHVPGLVQMIVVPGDRDTPLIATLDRLGTVRVHYQSASVGTGSWIVGRDRDGFNVIGGFEMSSIELPSPKEHPYRSISFQPVDEDTTRLYILGGQQLYQVELNLRTPTEWSMPSLIDAAEIYGDYPVLVNAAKALDSSKPKKHLQLENVTQLVNLPDSRFVEVRGDSVWSISSTQKTDFLFNAPALLTSVAAFDLGSTLHVYGILQSTAPTVIHWNSETAKVEEIPFTAPTGVTPVAITADSATRLIPSFNLVAGALSNPFGDRGYWRVLVAGSDGGVYGWNGTDWVNPGWSILTTPYTRRVPSNGPEIQGGLWMGEHGAGKRLEERRLRAMGFTENQILVLLTRWEMRANIHALLEYPGSGVSEYLASLGVEDRNFQVLLLELAAHWTTFKEDAVDQQTRESLDFWIPLLKTKTLPALAQWPNRGNYPSAQSFAIQKTGIEESSGPDGEWFRFVSANGRLEQPLWKTLHDYLASPERGSIR